MLNYGCRGQQTGSFSVIVLLTLLLAPVTLRAEVSAASEGGFVSRHVLIVEATPTDTWIALTEKVADWWDPAHSHSGYATSFSMDARAGGCFCEALPDGGSVMHMQVVFAAPGKLLRLSGGLGPLQGMGVSGAMTFALEAADGGHTTLRYQYVVSGYAPDGLAGLAGPVDAVQLGQLERLAAYLAER